MAKKTNNPRWMKAIEEWVWSDNIPLTVLAERTNIPYDTIVRWFRDVDFLKALEKRYYSAQTVEWLKCVKAQMKEAQKGNSGSFNAVKPIVEKNIVKTEGMISPYSEFTQNIQINNISSEKEVQDPVMEVQNKVHDKVHTEVHEIPEVTMEESKKTYTRPYKKQKVNKEKRNALLRLKRRANKVGLAPLGTGRPTRTEKAIWLKRLEKLEEKAGIKHPSP